MAMKALEEKILKEGQVLPGHILKVGSFLNQSIDTSFMMEMGKEIARLYKDSGVTKILTIESSGIALAFAAGVCLDVPVVFAKKSASANVSGRVLTASVHSYTHGNDFTAVVPAAYFTPEDKVLLVDDFLANGEALRGLLAILKEAGCEAVGAAIAIEKGFQGGGSTLRSQGLRIESLAIVESMSEDSLTFRR